MDSTASRRGRLTASQRWLALLTSPVDAASLGFFRIVFGVAVAIDAWRYLAYGWVDLLYIRPTLHFHYLGFEFVHPWPGTWMRAHFWALSAVALCLAAGLFYRAAAIVLFVAYLYVFLLDQAAYMNHHYLMLLIALLLIFVPAANAFSIDRRIHAVKPGGPEALAPRWCVWLLRFQLTVVYVYSGLARLDPDWLRGEPMRTTLAQMAGGYSESLTAVAVPLLAAAIAWGGVFADFAIPLLLLLPRTAPIGWAVAVIFHGANALALNIGIFSYLMVGMLPIFLSPSWPRRAIARLRGVSAPSVHAGEAPRTSPLVLAFLHVYVAVQLLVPLRHWLYPGPVRWTEEGHRFSWRMMLRTKRSEIRLLVTDPATNETWTIEPASDLNPVQRRELETAPDVVLQYVHAHRDRLRAAGIDPVIRVDWMCSLNGRRPQRLADPDVDLARIERTWRPSTWILPLADD
jgi:hypothetical protein